MWNASKCDLCGDCLTKCRYVDYDKDTAVNQIQLLMDGKDAEILHQCITCNACYTNCPTGADPADLIYKMQEKIGTNPIALRGKEARWANYDKAFEGKPAPGILREGDPDKPVLSLSSFAEDVIPGGAHNSKLFEGMTVVSGTQYSGLVGLVHAGKASVVKKYAKNVIDNLAALGKDILYFHNEGFILAHLRAKELGISVPFKYMYLFEYLRDYLKDHKEDITPINKKVAYQANCATRWLPEYDQYLAEIFDLVGVERPSREYEGENALCCAGPAIAVNKELGADIQHKNVTDAINAGAEALIQACPMCYRSLANATQAHGLNNMYITDLCSIAIGEKAWPST